MRVVVADQAGKNIAGVNVVITHTPTGRVRTLQSNASGVVTARGLPIGGPYKVALGENAEFSAKPVENIFLELGKTRLVNLALASTSAGSTAAIEEVVVVASAGTTDLRVGVGRDFGEAEIEVVPSISRDFVSTIATDPKILVDNSVARGPAVSIAGQNFRFNSVTIDGVAQNDNFGLSKNASATQRTPISIDAIQSINVNVAPFDVTYGNFIGGNINIVTQSGTNEFHGSAYGFTTGDGLSGNKSGSENLGIGNFDENTFGATLGGPIIEDKLFFFLNFEKFQTSRPSNTQTIDNIAGVTQQDVDEAISIFKDVYGFDPGTFDATDTDKDKKILAKLDWNINENHRAVASFQRADGDVLFDDFPEIAVLQSNRYNINERLRAWSFQEFADWTDNFSTEVKLGFKNVSNRQISVDRNTPDFAVTTAAGGTIAAGGDRFRHTNELDNKSRLFRFKGDYFVGDHTITAGFEQEKDSVRNLFLPFSKGQFFFNSLDDLRNRNINFALYGNSNTGVDQDAEANFDLTTNSVYLQDEWTPTDDLTLKFGVRYDFLRNNDPIKFNQDFVDRNGFTNTENLDGKSILLPRFGFNWQATDRLTIRGGAGLFGGGSPLIVLSNSYSGDGISRTFASFFAPFIPGQADLFAQVAASLPDPTAARTAFQPLIGVNPVAEVDAISPDFDILSTWKFSIGADYVADLSSLGLGDDWKISAEILQSEVKDGFDIREGRRQVIGSAPDGRPIYDITADADYIVTNTGQGNSTVFTFDVAKTFYSDYGTFDTTFGYTHQNVEEIRSLNRFVAFETFAFDPQTDLNNPQKATSRFETPNRVTATFSWQKELFGDNMTSLSLVYIGRSGPRFTYVFGSQGLPTFGGAFLADFGSEGDNPGPELFYVPTGINDPIVTGDPEFLANLDKFIDSDSCLRGARGTTVSRNACSTGWINSLDLRFVQEVGVWKDSKLEFIFDIENVLNLLSNSWGRVDSYTAPSNVAVANVAITQDGSQFLLTPTSTDVVSPDTVVPNPTIARLPSVYRLQFGLRYRF